MFGGMKEEQEGEPLPKLEKTVKEEGPSGFQTEVNTTFKLPSIEDEFIVIKEFYSNTIVSEET